MYAGNIHPGDYDYDPNTEDRPASAEQAVQVKYPLRHTHKKDDMIEGVIR